MNDASSPSPTAFAPTLRAADAGSTADRPDPVAVRAVDLGKAYKVYDRPWDRVLEGISRHRRHREFEALSGVSFELRRGEGLGVIGENGAGKSTLLKMLAGIVAPSTGRLEVNGTVASILELGSGFHPDFTGRQNIVLNAAMLGLDEARVRAKTPEIIEFSELGDFIDQPVKVYSSGMAMRLGFAIAIQVDPEVLIIDEALSVGDGYFQKKCMDRLQSYLEAGGTLLFCSHAMYYVSAFCTRALWLHQGRAQALGTVPEVVRAYEDHLQAKRAAAHRSEVERADAELGDAGPGSGSGDGELAPQVEGGPARWTRTEVFGLGDHEGRFAPGEALELELAWECDDPSLAFQVGVGINRTVDQLEVASLSTHHEEVGPLTGAREHRLRLVLPELPLVKGEFDLHFFLLDGNGLHIYDQRQLARAFRVESPRYAFGIVRMDHRWSVETPGREPASPTASSQQAPSQQSPSQQSPTQQSSP